MIKFAQEGSILALLPYFVQNLENFRVSYVWYKDGNYGYHLDYKLNPFDKLGKEKHFDLLVKNDFEFFLNPLLNTNVSLKRFNKILRLGLIAKFGSQYRIALDKFIDEQRYAISCPDLT